MAFMRRKKIHVWKRHLGFQKLFQIFTDSTNPGPHSKVKSVKLLWKCVSMCVYVCVCVCVHISEHMHTPSTCLCEINMAEVSLNAEQSRFCPSLALRSSETIKLHHSGNSEALRNTNYKSCKLYSKMCYSWKYCCAFKWQDQNIHTMPALKLNPQTQLISWPGQENITCKLIISTANSVCF